LLVSFSSQLHLLVKCLTIAGRGTFLGGSLAFVVDTEVAVLAQTLGVEGPLCMTTDGGHLGSALGVVTVFAHAVSIVLLVGVVALRDMLPMFLEEFGLRARGFFLDFLSPLVRLGAT